MSVAVNHAYQNADAKPAIPTKEHEIIVEPTSHSPSETNPLVGGNRIEFLNLPTSSSANGSFISVAQSYIKITLKCNVQAGDGKTARFTSVGGHGLFERVQVNSSSYPVEDTQHYNMLYKMLQDMNSGDTKYEGATKILQGIEDGHKGVQLGKTNTTDTETKSITLILPLIGQFWNSVSGYMPVHNITDLAYRLTLVPNDQAMVSVGGDGAYVSFEISECNLHLMYVEMSPQSRDMIASKVGNSWSSPQYEVLRDVLNAQASHTHKIPSAKSSVKQISISYHDSARLSGRQQDEDCTARYDPNIETVQFSVNGVLYPANPVKNRQQQLAQTLNAFHQLHQPNDKIIQFGKDSPSKTVKPELDQYLISQSFESFGMSSKAFSGVSTLAQNPMCIITSEAANSGLFLGSDVFYYINYDARYEIQNGVVRVSY